MKLFKRVLVANRGEIAIRLFRACKELGIRSVAIYTEEDANSLFRSMADEAYLIGKNKGPIEAYLDINSIIELAQNKGVDAIHPGYGFLSENSEFAKRCEEAGIVFIGPSHHVLETMGDKIKSKVAAIQAKVPVIPGTEKPILDYEEALAFTQTSGYPLMIKAAAGGGGRGMRIVWSEEALKKNLDAARNEAIKAFGSGDIFMEKYLFKPKHIEVQVLGDNSGNIVHLYERDCSIQRRHQKVIEIAPSISIDEATRNAICQDAVRIAKHVNYTNAGTVEFLVDSDNNHYFIEMNPRIQVEHTITENITGIDLVQSQILIAAGCKLTDEAIGIDDQSSISLRGHAIQCRVTTEDPSNNFMPDTGKLRVYKVASGLGIRIDGNGYEGAEISPYYDSLLLKCIATGRTYKDTIRKAVRALQETDIRGVKTNIPFLINVLNHASFLEGTCDTSFIESNEDLFNILPQKDIEEHALRHIANTVVNVTHGKKMDFNVPIVPLIPEETLSGSKQLLDQEGPDGLVKWIKKQKKLLITDTSMRDAHQSLMATRMRTQDMKKIAGATAYYGKDLFSFEMWGGATFDVAYRFLKEDPWERLRVLRKRIPNVLFQMLIRGSNGVGYKNYPDNVVRALIKRAAENGIDIFRIFDSLNWLEGMEVAIDEVKKQGKVAEVAICYTGDILDENRSKYNLDYYVKKAVAIEKMGAHILAIKDMSALLKPYAAYKLIKAIKREVSIPVHLHTHDTSGNGVATLLMAAEAGVDIVDVAFNALAGLTSQPALNSVVAALENTDRDTELIPKDLQHISDYWRAVRPVYSAFESSLKSSEAEIYKYEIPGGQYSNLKPQIESFGLGHRFNDVKDMYRRVNHMFGDLVKVTPSSKAVGDMAIFMVQNNLTPQNILNDGQGLAYPDSVVALFKGMMGQVEGGLPKDLQKLILKDDTPITCRPGALLEPVDFEGLKKELSDKFAIVATEEDLISYAFYPKVFGDYLTHIKSHGDLSQMGSDIYFHGLTEGETCELDLSTGQKLRIKLLTISEPDDTGQKQLEFEVNGNRRRVKVQDIGSDIKRSSAELAEKANPNNPKEIGANIPGKVAKILVKKGQKVKKNEEVVILEAMKMETAIVAQTAGVVEQIEVAEQDEVTQGQLIIKIN